MSKPGEWKLVEDLSELRVGMTVKGEPCSCGRGHVGVLARRLSGVVGIYSDRLFVGDAFRVAPEWHPSQLIGQPSIACRVVFRLVTGNDDEAEKAEGARHKEWSPALCVGR